MGHEVRAFKHDRADLRMPRHQEPGGIDHFILSSRVSIDRGISQQGALETAVIRQPYNRDVERRTNALKVWPAQARRIESENARAFAPCKKSVYHRNLHQGARGDGNAEPARKLGLINGEKSAACDDAINPIFHKRLTRGNKRLEK